MHRSKEHKSLIRWRSRT